MGRFCLFLCFVLSFFLNDISSVGAQDYIVIDRLTELNRIPPLQHPDFHSAHQVLDRKILDRKNRTVGEAQDIILNRNGSILSLVIDFNRLRLTQPVYLNYRKHVDRPSSKGYILSLNDDQIEERYPELLSDIETASGQNNEKFSVQNLLGAPVEAEDGRRLGLVEDVLFGDEGRQAEALDIVFKRGMLRGDHIAVPINMVDIVSKASRKKQTIVVSNDEADAIITVAENLD